jgi:hypothetical protein
MLSIKEQSAAQRLTSINVKQSMTNKMMPLNC